MHLQQLKGRPKQGMWKGLHEWKVYERGNFSVKNGIWKEKALDSRRTDVTRFLKHSTWYILFNIRGSYPNRSSEVQIF